MGGGYWSADAYAAAEAYRRRRGQDAFDYDDRIRRTRREEWRAHPTLDPYGVTVREARDSAEHPNSVPIAVLFDVTGSMRSVPRVLQTKLPKLLGLLKEKGYTTDPQIMFGAIGDATCDRVPLQVGQFESDNRMDRQLESILLEGGGGGQMTESYELALYFMAKHTALDSLEKRGKKGYLFLIGDELPYDTVDKQLVRSVIGDDARYSMDTAEVVDRVQEKFHVFYLLPEGTSHARDPRVPARWRELLGQNVIQLGDLDAVCEVIALLVGLGEGTIDLDTGLDDLRRAGSDQVHTVRRALDTRARAAARVRMLPGR